MAGPYFVKTAAEGGSDGNSGLSEGGKRANIDKASAAWKDLDKALAEDKKQ